MSHAFPVPSLPSTARGTMSTEPSDQSSKVKLPNATSPEPRRLASSWTSAFSMTSRSHFSPTANRSGPEGSVTRVASPQPVRPAPCRIQASAAGSEAGDQITWIRHRHAAHHQVLAAIIPAGPSVRGVVVPVRLCHDRKL